MTNLATITKSFEDLVKPAKPKKYFQPVKAHIKNKLTTKVEPKENLETKLPPMIFKKGLTTYLTEAYHQKPEDSDYERYSLLGDSQIDSSMK